MDYYTNCNETNGTILVVRIKIKKLMTENLKDVLELGAAPRVAFVGSGGKTTSLFCVARDYDSPVIATSTSHLEYYQTKFADRHFYWEDFQVGHIHLPEPFPGIALISGPRNSRAVEGLASDHLDKILYLADRFGIPLLIEADGSRRHPVKAPANHEPPIPEFVDTVVVVVGLSALGQPCNSKWVHRPEVYAHLSGLQIGNEITLEAMERVLCHPLGGLKNIPRHARRIALINQADTPDLVEKAVQLADGLSTSYHSMVIASLKQNTYVHQMGFSSYPASFQANGTLPARSL